MPRVDLDNLKKIHLIGIGGIGISAIARMFLLQGKTISGSDQSLSVITEELAQAGARVFKGHNAGQVPTDADLVIYTIAISAANPELAKAKELNIPALSYPEVLGLVSRDKYTIAVAGTHGKTTTTAMIAEIALAAGLNPTVIVGSILKNHQSNFIAGQGHYLIAEACEYRRSFLNLYPKILVITNIEEEHLDYYKNLADIQNSFAELASRVPADGFVIADSGDPKVAPALERVKARIIDYSSDLSRLHLDKSSGIDLASLKLQVPGEHNLKNAGAAWAVAEALGLPAAEVKKALTDFAGTWRRFEYKGQTKAGAKVYDDYAHHPTEIKATLKAARSLAGRHKIIVAFQPHLYSRTKILFNDFTHAFHDADQVFLAPIYAAREKTDDSISSQQLAEAINQTGIEATAINSFEKIKEKINQTAKENDLIIIMGAGELFKIATELVSSSKSVLEIKNGL